MHVERKPIEILYDGLCPVCSAYVKYQSLGLNGFTVHLRNARTEPGLVGEYADRGIDLNRDFVLRFGEAEYVGPEAMCVLSALASKQRLFARLSASMLRLRVFAYMLYPVLRMGRRSLLLLLGRRPLGTSSIQSGAQTVTTAAVFVGGQITLSYISSGFAKLASPKWRSGRALADVMNHHTYGDAAFSKILKRYAWLSPLLCMYVITFQVSFLMFYFLRLPYAYIYIMGGTLFHAGIAYFMRLNLFFIAFVGTYPCLLFTHEWARAIFASL